MYSAILRRIRQNVRRGEYVMTAHADEEADADGLTIFDVESAILTGVIRERQRDRDSMEWKYLVAGESIGGSPVCVVLKIGAASGLVYIITVYAE
jgi:hypothetical protein